MTHGPISITVPAAATLLLGTITGMSDDCGFGLPDIYTEAEVGVSWKAVSSAGPVVSYSISGLGQSGEIYGNNTFAFTGPTSGVQWVENYLSHDCGGGDVAIGWVIRATDSAGNHVQARVYYALGVTRFDNTAPGGGGGPGTWTFAGTWAVSHCVCADGYQQTFTTQKAATAVYTIGAASMTTPGDHLALMMAKGPGRGYANLYVDGRLRATINTHASVNTNRVIVWDSGPLAAGSHVIKVVNLATPGHPRIDVNAMLSTSP